MKYIAAHLFSIIEKRRCRVGKHKLIWLVLVSLFANSAWAETQLNLTKGVTAVSRDVYDLHMLVLYICTAIGVLVFGAMFWSIAFHRKWRPEHCCRSPLSCRWTGRETRRAVVPSEIQALAAPRRHRPPPSMEFQCR